MYNDQQPNPGSWQEEEQRMTLPPSPLCLLPPKRGNGFSTASMTAGTLSLFFLVSGLSFPVGALGILFALLSRKGDKMDPQAKLGCILSIIGLCLGIAIFIYAAVTVYQNFPELIQQYQQLYEMYQGGM